MRNQITVEVNERASSYHILKSSNLTTGFLFISSELSPASVQQRSTPNLRSEINIKAIHNFEKGKIFVFKDLDINGSVFDMTSLGISAGRGVKSQPDQLIR